MNIGIIGAGNVGGTLGRRWAANGHTVTWGTREPGSVAAAVRSADTVLLATPWTAVQDALSAAGDLSGKVLIDATNPLLPSLEGLSIGTTISAAEQVAARAPGARVVKAFNTVGANIMENPKFASGEVAMFYCGDDSGACAIVAGLISELGFDALHAGPLGQARLLEPFALLWISLALKQGFSREIGFALLRR